ncbi:hypothetical protein PR048_025114 [Dryococelus australis]|uniref:Uncharacterized protein n=1 Tax=Dryococelus australis TaxID=614101 RepID=A0ABQ9GQI6_9NEOP|nr:hypothetical protein PR048_025114 [Dryococelus australis]
MFSRDYNVFHQGTTQFLLTQIVCVWDTIRKHQKCSKKNFQMFGDLLGVQVYFDDIIIAEHDDRLVAVLVRVQKCHVKFNPNKIQFQKQTLKFMRQICCKERVKKNGEYIQAIVGMKTPQSKDELLRFLGMVRYVGKFTPNLCQVSAPVRGLGRQDVDRKWEQERINSFNELKQLFRQAPLLAFYDPKVAIQMYADARKDGLGAYAQVEKECLAIQFARIKFHNFIYGHHDITNLWYLSDRKTNNLSARLQILRLLAYDLNICYLPGKLQYIADTLFRAFIIDTSNDLDREVVNAVIRSSTAGLLKQAHEGHKGIEKTKLRTSTEVEEYVKRCSMCSQYSRQNSKKCLSILGPLLVATDIVTYGGVSYLVVIDAYSIWL